MFHATKTLFMKNKLICIGTTTFGAAAYLIGDNDPIKSSMSYTNNRISYAAWSVAEKVAKTTASYSFGNNLFGQLGLGNDVKQIQPIFVENLPTNDNVSFIDASFDQSAFVTRGGKLFTCGCGAHDRLGHSHSDSNQTLPQLVESLSSSEVTSVSIGGFHMICLCSNGDVYSFGRNNFSQLGHDNQNPGDATKINNSPFGGKKVTQVSAGRMHSAVLLENGLVYTWGCGHDGALGHGNKSKQTEPKLVETLKDKRAVNISCGRDYTIVVMDDGSVYSFGRDGNGQLGQGRKSLVVSAPKKINLPASEKALKAAAGDAHVLLATESGKVFSWGDGQQGQLGHGGNTNIYLPREIDYFVDENEKIIDVAAGASHSGCVSEDGKLFLFGKGRSGQLGRGDQLESNAAYRVTPVKVEGLKNVVQVALGKEHSLCLVEEK